MTKRNGSIWIFATKAMLFLVVMTVFFVGQILFYEQTLFYFWGNYIVLLLYAANVYSASKIFQAFDFGGENLSEIIISWILCLIVANTLQYLILSLLELMLLPIVGFLGILGSQIALVIPLALLNDKLYYHLNPAHKAIIIYREANKAEFYRGVIGKHRKKFDIRGVISQEEPIQILLSLIRESESVFFLDVDEIKMDRLLQCCFLHNKRTYVLPNFSSVMINTAKLSWISNTPVFLSKSPEPDVVIRMIKRSMDIFVSLLMIVGLSWLMLVIWCAVRLCDRSPAIYKQTRITKGGKLFTLYKFRSMRPDAEGDGIPRLSSSDDDRITPVGRIIRGARLDELPQLFNVFAGSMSLVGPRPERPEIAAQYEEVYPCFALRTKVKAGMTGLAQIYGRYNTAPEEKLFLDVMYIETLSIWEDFKLLLQTIKVIFMPSSTEGITSDATTALRVEEQKWEKREKAR